MLRGYMVMDEIGEREYVELVGYQMLQVGYRNIEFVRTEKMGADITAADPYSRKVCVRCRCYGRKPVGVKAVNEAERGKGYYNCSFGIVASHSGYTAEAKTLAKEKGILLWDV